jgi:hypothetical protein
VRQKGGSTRTSAALAIATQTTAAKKNHTGIRNAKRTPATTGFVAASKVAAKQTKASKHRGLSRATNVPCIVHLGSASVADLDRTLASGDAKFLSIRNSPPIDQQRLAKE